MRRRRSCESLSGRWDTEMSRLVLATKNPGKVLEIKEILKHLPIEVVACSAYRGIPDVVEDGETFRDNAMSKARVIAGATGQVALADDSGLEVDVLCGAPGVHSARFAGGDLPRGRERDRANYEKLLSRLEGVGDAERTARFRCVAALAEFLHDGVNVLIHAKIRAIVRQRVLRYARLEHNVSLSLTT
jgi:non-canonical purine NTP pyrophosphatase (RdgB/HAM1 family)